MDEIAIHSCYQNAEPGEAALSPGEVHVWAVEMVGDAQRYAPLLSEDEQDRAERFRFVDHRRRYSISHGALRAILAGYLACDPLEIAFDTGRNKKPALQEDAPRLRFNLSHSAKLALVAVGDVEVGVDLEKMRHLESLREIARHNFAAAEIAAIEAAGADERLLAFYRCWTRKEAYVKALGTGLGAPLDVFDVGIESEARFLGFRDGQSLEQWGLWDVSPAEDYIAAVCARSQQVRIQTYRLAPL
jgi:4'-phosphopantetheinyl transferase